tara:strand:- start:128 stop:667 length:540 start_codon:yes stop_codon:yes gene_type:complete
MKKIFLICFLFVFIFSFSWSQQHTWTESEKKQCMTERLKKMTSDKEGTSSGLMILQQYKKSKEEVVSCYCAKLEKTYKTYKVAREFINKKDRKSDRESFEMGFSCFNDKSEVGKWSTEMKKICFKLLQAPSSGLSEKQANCFCETIEKKYVNFFEFGEAAKYNEIKDQELMIEFQNCQK